jgi:glycine betaine/proline transport system ATP-binding protein
MREHQLGSLMVVDRERRLRGVVMEDEVARAVERGQDDLTGLVLPAVTVHPETAVADLFAASADSASALAVVDGERLVGVIPRVTLLSALGAVGGGGHPHDQTTVVGSTPEEVAR